jgi:hypothetical protein
LGEEEGGEEEDEIAEEGSQYRGRLGCGVHLHSRELLEYVLRTRIESVEIEEEREDERGRFRGKYVLSPLQILISSTPTPSLSHSPFEKISPNEDWPPSDPAANNSFLSSRFSASVPANKSKTASASDLLPFVINHLGEKGRKGAAEARKREEMVERAKGSRHERDESMLTEA